MASPPSRSYQYCHAGRPTCLLQIRWSSDIGDTLSFLQEVNFIFDDGVSESGWHGSAEQRVYPTDTGGAATLMILKFQI